MTRYRGRLILSLGGFGCLWVLIASAVAAGVLAGGLLLGALSPAAASRSAQQADLPFPSGRMTTERADPLPSPDSAGRSGAPHDPASVPAAASGDARPAGAPPSPATGMRPASSEAPRTAASLRGIATWYCLPGRSPCTAGYPATGAYAAAGPALRAALGDWRGRTVTVSADGRSVEVALVDFCRCDGGGLIDLYAGVFGQMAPLSVGLVRVTVTPVPLPERRAP